MKENTKNYEIATVEIDHDVFAVKAENGGAVVRYSTTVDDVDLFNAVNGGSESIKNYMGVDLSIAEMVVTSANVHEEKENEDSPIVSKPCVHFFTTDGKHLATLSNGVIRAAMNLIQCGFTPTRETPIVIKFKTIETKKGTAHTFDLISR